jgi:hypothetical protein
MKNPLFTGILAAAMLWNGVSIFSAIAAPNQSKISQKKPVRKPATTKPEAKPEVKPEAKVEPTQTMVNSTTIKDSGIRYDLTSCKREGENVACRLLLTNKKKDDVAVSFKVAGTRFIDKDGEEYRAKEVRIGSARSETEAENTLISETPTKAMVIFDAPPTNVATMRALAIAHSPGNTLKFRDVKIEKLPNNSAIVK